MDLSPLHLHLMLNHLPLFGTIFVLLLLLWSWARRSREGMRIGLWLAVLLALATIPVYLTGEPAEHQLRDLDPSAPRRLMHEHEESGERGFYFILATGAVALVALWATRRRGEPAAVGVVETPAATDVVVVERAPAAQGRGAWPLVVMVCLIVAFYLFAYAALLGGQIRHPELRTPSSVVPPGATPATAPNPS